LPLYEFGWYLLRTWLSTGTCKRRGALQKSKKMGEIRYGRRGVPPKRRESAPNRPSLGCVSGSPAGSAQVACSLARRAGHPQSVATVILGYIRPPQQPLRMPQIG
jgi:hypothetical protein